MCYFLLPIINYLRFFAIIEINENINSSRKSGNEECKEILKRGKGRMDQEHRFSKKEVNYKLFFYLLKSKLSSCNKIIK